MLSLLKIENIALIDHLDLDFGPGLNLLTGETGSGKSIIVDSLGALTGDRVSGDLIKEGHDAARIEGLFAISRISAVNDLLEESGIRSDGELIIRREISRSGKNRIFVNDQLVTQAVLKKLGAMLVDIHGQGEQTSLYDPHSHIEMLDGFAGVDKEKKSVADAFRAWSDVRDELGALQRDESEKLQLLDILRFQVNEISSAGLTRGEDQELEQEKHRLNNAEKLSGLSAETYALLYENDDSTISTLERAARKIAELAEFDRRFAENEDGLRSAQAVIEELAIAARDFRAKLEFSPERLNEIETRLAEISRLTRKYGGSVESVLEHLRITEQRLENIETAEFREKELQKQLENLRADYTQATSRLHDKRTAAAAKFEKAVVTELRTVALEKARFEVRIETTDAFSPNGSDRVEFYFSANPGESPKPLAKVASGGEASRLMLILKTASRSSETGKVAVFDEVDIGIGGRVAEAVGRKLKDLSQGQQVFCVTHQPQIASLAEHHFIVEKNISGRTTIVAAHELDATGRIEEIARMLAGEQITDAARENARTMIANAG